MTDKGSDGAALFPAVFRLVRNLRCVLAGVVPAIRAAAMLRRPPGRHGRACPGHSRGRHAAAGLAALAILLSATAAGAQSYSDLWNQISNLRSQINNQNNQIAGLRTQLNDLEREVHIGTAPPALGAEDGLMERNSRRLAALETDIDEAREWRRYVAGRFEELDNAMRRIEGRIERLVADVDFRLSSLEEGLGAAPVDAGAAPAAPAGEAAAEPAVGAAATVAPERDTGYTPSDEPRALGTIPVERPADDAPPPARAPDEQYREAFALLEAADYEEAHDAFAHFIEANAGHELAQNAAYWRAETLYVRQMYDEAVKAYAQNLRKFPDGRKAPDNMIKLGMSLLKLGRNEDACRAFAQLDRTFPELALNIRRAQQQGRRQANCR